MSGKTLLGCVAAGLVLASATGGLGHGKHHHHHGLIPSLDSLAPVPARATSASANERLSMRLATSQHGWRGAQHTCLNELWTQESGFNNLAQNPHSTAFGIAQFLDTTWAPYGPKTSDARTQIIYGLDYIRDRYRDPCTAEDHEQANNWY